MTALIAAVIAIVAFIASLASPIIVAKLTNDAQEAKENREVERQELVATKAEESRAAAADEIKKTAQLLEENTRLATESAAETHAQLAQVHTLVNSDKTAGLERERDALIANLALMTEVVDLKRAAGSEASESTVAALELTRARIGELESQLADRARATVIGESQVEENP